MMAKKLSANYLDYIPVYKQGLEYKTDDDGSVTLYQENKGLFYFITQKLLGKPRISQIHLDEMGTFIWPLINGEHSVMDISVSVKEHFGEKAEPLYDRLVTYMAMLERYGFIEFINK